MSTRIVARIGRVAGIAAVVLAATGAVAQEPTLVLANPGGAGGDASRAAFYQTFSAATKTKIVEDTFTQELSKLRAQVETKQVKWDVVELTAINEATACEEGLLEKIDWSQYIDTKLIEGVGGAGACGIPFLFVSGAITYDADKLKEGPKSWADFWDVQKFPGKRGLIYRAEQSFEPALMADGVPPGKVTETLAQPGGVDRALRKLDGIKPNVVWWKNGAESIQLLASGEVVMTYAWNSRVSPANRSQNRAFKMVLEAGHVSGSQYFAIMKGSPNKDLATRFIAHAMQPQPQAAYARMTSVGPANADAYALLTDAEKATLPGTAFMDRGVLQKGKQYLSFWVDNGDALLQRFIRFAAQ